MAALNPAIIFERSPAKHAEGPKVLVVTNMYPHATKPSMGVFVKEQVDSLRALGLEVDVLFVNGPASRANYLRGVLSFWHRLMRYRYDLIHAHYIYSGLIARMQARCPVVITFHSGEFYAGRLECTSRSLARQRQGFESKEDEAEPQKKGFIAN